ncbi:hypothetical protein ACQP3L_32000, partial [Escherichia coli]
AGQRPMDAQGHQLKKEMCRWQCKNTFNNIKSNMAPPKTNDSTTEIPEHSSIYEAEENNLKITLSR